jgi:hypothetical protein
VPNQSRLTEPAPRATDKRKVITLTAAHLPASAVVLPEDVQDVRAFGSESVEAGLQAQATVINEKLAAMKTDIEATREYHRVGALRGQVLDADGATVITNLFTAFGVAKKTASVAFSTATTDVRKACLDVKRHIEKKTGGLVVSGFPVLCAPDFFDALTGHESVKAAFDNWQAAQDRLGGDMRKGFTYGGLNFIECADEVVSGNTTIPFIPAGKAQAFPNARGAYVTYNAPANYNEAVNTVGQAFYAKAEPRRMGKGWDLEAQSNPLTLCLYPEALVEISAA